MLTTYMEMDTEFKNVQKQQETIKHDVTELKKMPEIRDLKDKIRTQASMDEFNGRLDLISKV